MGLAEASRRNAEVVQAMGMSTRLNAIWHDHNRKNIAASQRVADISGGMAALSRILRMILQSAVLGIGAWLVINQQATAGIIIASSILTSRALAPVEVRGGHIGFRPPIVGVTRKEWQPAQVALSPRRP